MYDTARRTVAFARSSPARHQLRFRRWQAGLPIGQRQIDTLCPVKCLPYGMRSLFNWGALRAYACPVSGNHRTGVVKQSSKYRAEELACTLDNKGK
jgi:hypothetical protein